MAPPFLSDIVYRNGAKRSREKESRLLTQKEPRLLTQKEPRLLTQKEPRHQTRLLWKERFDYLAALAALMDSISSGTTLNRSPTIP